MTVCRSCGQTGLQSVLNLGRSPLANVLPSEADLAKPDRMFPLELVWCPACCLVQLTETVPPADLFSEYLYFSSFSDAMLAHARQIAEQLVRERKLNAQSLVLEIGSNDGYLLQYFQQAGIPVLGIEPAANIAQEANRKRVRTMNDFFGATLAETLPKADVRSEEH